MASAGFEGETNPTTKV